MPLRNWADLVNEAGDVTSNPGFDPLPAGNYDLVVIEAGTGRSSGGKDAYEIKCEVESGPYKGRKVFNTFYVSPESPAAMQIFFRQMNAIGLPPDFWMSNPSDETIIANLTNKRLIGTLNIEEYNGTKRNKVKNVSAPRPGGPVQAGPAVPGLPVGVTPPRPSVSPVAPSVPSFQAPQAPQAPAQYQVAQAPVQYPTQQAQPDPWAQAQYVAPQATQTSDPWASAPPQVPSLS